MDGVVGAIVGDIIGSVYEGSGFKRRDFPLFSAHSRYTDDTVLTVAVADCLLSRRPYTERLRHYCLRYPDAGYGGAFRRWARSDRETGYGSWGNGSAMRVAPVAYAHADLSAVLDEAARSAAATHDHPEGIRGAQAVAAAVFLARTGTTRAAMGRYVSDTFGYDLSQPVDAIRAGFGFDVSCAGTVPPALRCFLEADDFEAAVRNAVSLGGDADTLASIAGAVAGAYHGVPAELERAAMQRLPPELAAVLTGFRARFAPEA